MPTAFFQVCLSVQPTRGGEAEIGVPQALRGLNYGFVIVKDGGQEGIIKIEGAETLLRQVEKDHDCKKLTAKQAEALQGGYPQPRGRASWNQSARFSTLMRQEGRLSMPFRRCGRDFI
jgi:hypothetical protein